MIMRPSRLDAIYFLFFTFVLTFLPYLQVISSAAYYVLFVIEILVFVLLSRRGLKLLVGLQGILLVCLVYSTMSLGVAGLEIDKYVGLSFSVASHVLLALVFSRSKVEFSYSTPRILPLLGGAYILLFTISWGSLSGFYDRSESPLSENQAIMVAGLLVQLLGLIIESRRHQILLAIGAFSTGIVSSSFLLLLVSIFVFGLVALRMPRRWILLTVPTSIATAVYALWAFFGEELRWLAEFHGGILGMFAKGRIARLSAEQEIAPRLLFGGEFDIFLEIDLLQLFATYGLVAIPLLLIAYGPLVGSARSLATAAYVALFSFLSLSSGHYLLQPYPAVTMFAIVVFLIKRPAMSKVRYARLSSTTTGAAQPT